ncbi:MAG: dimethylarginine dimethylaminohydrolase family protein [bacterium]
MLRAIVHPVSPRITECELTHLERTPIDPKLAAQQHQAYCALLRDLGVQVVELSAKEVFPDAVFVEDTAVVFDDVAVSTNMGAASRRGEVAAVEAVLSKHRLLARVQPPATLEGGDVVLIGNTVFVGRTGRTNNAGIRALRHILQRFDYHVLTVETRGCLHLKSAVTAISERSLLVNPDWVDLTPFSDFNVITVDESEPRAANAFYLEETVCLHAGFPKTVALLRELEFKVATVDISEFLKAEGGLSCLSIRFQA